MKKVHRAVLVAVAIIGASLALPAAAGGSAVSSTFTTDDEGWRVAHNSNPVSLQTPTFHSTGGNPGGYISGTDAVAETCMPATDCMFLKFEAPAAYTGDHSDAYGGAFDFDLMPDGQSVDRGPSVNLFASNNSFLQGPALPTPSASGWTTYSQTLDENSGFLYCTGGCVTATEQQVKDVLGDLAIVDVMADVHNGTGETIGFDNAAMIPDTDGDGVLDPSDECPTVPGPGPSGCPNVSRDLTIAYSNAAKAFKGRLRPAGACSAEEEVKVYSRRPGPDRRVGKDTTNGNGRYKIRSARHPGTYYAVAPASIEASEGTCVAAKSSRLHLG